VERLIFAAAAKTQPEIVLCEPKTVKICVILANFTPKLVKKRRFSRMHVVGCIQDVGGGFRASAQESCF
jgi:hypothetical protein